jgi:hypothetical protein
MLNILTGSGHGKERAARNFANVLYTYYQALLSPISMFEIKKSEVIPNQLGLFVKNGSVLKPGDKNQIVWKPYKLWGAVFELFEEIGKRLLAAKYPSLFLKDQEFYILVGPICLVNHACNAALTFCKMKIPGFTIKHFEGLDFIYTSYKGERKRVITRGKELFMNYFGDNGCDFDKCLCKDCI